MTAHLKTFGVWRVQSDTTDTEPDCDYGSDTGPESSPDVGPITGPAFGPTVGPNSGPNTRTDYDYDLGCGPIHDIIPNHASTSTSRNTNILLDFYDSDSESNQKARKDILLNFDSDRGGDEDLDPSEKSTDDDHSESSENSAGMTRNAGEKYTEFDFGFLDEDWLEPTDEPDSSSSDESSNSSDSTDR